MKDLPDIKARLRRLQERMAGLAKEIGLWREEDGPLLPLEKHHYLTGIEEALGGLEKAHEVLTAAARRMEVQIALAGRAS
jgi:hypothetical protein